MYIDAADGERGLIALSANDALSHSRRIPSRGDAHLLRWYLRYSCGGTLTCCAGTCGIAAGGRSLAALVLAVERLDRHTDPAAPLLTLTLPPLWPSNLPQPQLPPLTQRGSRAPPASCGSAAL